MESLIADWKFSGNEIKYDIWSQFTCPSMLHLHCASQSYQDLSLLRRQRLCRYRWGIIMNLNLLPRFVTNLIERGTYSEHWAAFLPAPWILGRSVDDSCKGEMHSSIPYSSLICVIKSPETMINSNTSVCSWVVYLAVVNFDLQFHFKESLWHKFFL